MRPDPRPLDPQAWRLAQSADGEVLNMALLLRAIQRGGVAEELRHEVGEERGPWGGGRSMR